MNIIGKKGGEKRNAVRKNDEQWQHAGSSQHPVTTRYRKGLMAETSMASICSVTFMDPSSAPILELIFPAQITAVITGPISLITETLTMPGNRDTAPKLASEGRGCRVSTSPMIKEVTAVSGNDLFPTL